MRLLSEDEYFDQGRIETKNALESLRQFSRSPNCDAWKTIRRLKDPMRYIKIVFNFISSMLTYRLYHIANIHLISDLKSILYKNVMKPRAYVFNGTICLFYDQIRITNNDV